MESIQLLKPSADRPGSGQAPVSSPPTFAAIDQPIFLILDEALRRPAEHQRPGSRTLRWRRRLTWWIREKRLGLWVALLIGFIALAYALGSFTDASRRYGPSYYEPKDIERWEWVQHTPR